jgi:hypothetical protein
MGGAWPAVACYRFARIGVAWAEILALPRLGVTA